MYAADDSYRFDSLSSFNLLDRCFNVSTDGVVYHPVDEKLHVGHREVSHCESWLSMLWTSESVLEVQ